MKRFDELLARTARQAMQDDKRLRQVISRIVPAATLGQLAFCRLENEVLHLSVNNAVWLTQLRFVERSLLTRLREEGWRVKAVNGHVLPDRVPVARRQADRPAPQCSPRNAQGLSQLAETTDDARLKAALQRMAAHVGGKPGDQ